MGVEWLQQLLLTLAPTAMESPQANVVSADLEWKAGISELFCRDFALQTMSNRVVVRWGKS